VSRIQIGDWVFGRDVKGHKVAGFVLATMESQGWIKVQVTQSQLTTLLGREMFMPIEETKVSRKVSHVEIPAYYLNWIDIALDEKDEVAFKEFHIKYLEALQNERKSDIQDRRSSKSNGPVN
jgi:hypothetical protein